MSTNDYSLEDSIATFFSTQTDATKEECDVLAHSLLSAEASPVPMQGCYSYTIADHSRLVQFRSLDSSLDIEVLRRARSIHGPLVPITTYHGQIGKDRPLPVYIIEKLPGITYMEYHIGNDLRQRLDEEQYQKQRILIEDFARFFAASWKAPQAADMATKQRTIETDLNLLARTLPSRFSKPTLELLGSLNSIVETLPMVLTHGDFFEMNILIDENSGHLTGVIDWAEADVLPFGFGLGALENFLGYMDTQGWYYFDQHENLRALFWNAFYADVGEDVKELQGTVDLAARVSILLRRGFRWDEKMQRRVVEEGNSGVKYLDAFLL